MRGCQFDGRPFLALLPFDAHVDERTEATLRFWRLIRDGEKTDLPEFSGQKRDRLRTCLRALDAHLAGESYRTIAIELFGSERVEDEIWRTGSLRDAAIRFVRDGLLLMQGGYLNLLIRRKRARRRR